MEARTPDHVQMAWHALPLGLTIRLFPHATATAGVTGCREQRLRGRAYRAEPVLGRT